MVEGAVPMREDAATVEDLAPYFQHCFGVRRVDGGWQPVRFSDDLLARYANAGEAIGKRARDAAGVTLSLLAPAGVTVSFRYRADCFSRNHVVFDVFEDGVFATSVAEPDASAAGEVCIRIGRGARGVAGVAGAEDAATAPDTAAPLDAAAGATAAWLHAERDGVAVAAGGSTADSADARAAAIRGAAPGGASSRLVRVDIYLPYCARIVISDFCAPGSRPAPTRGQRTLFLGDSITQGIEVLHPALSYPLVASRQAGWDWLNQGVGGYVFDPQTLVDVAAVAPSRIVVAYGTNDFTHLFEGSLARSTWLDTLATYLERLAAVAGSASVAVLTPPWRFADVDTAERAGLMDWVRGAVADAARRWGFAVLDGDRLAARVRDLTFDGLHPNDAGALFLGARLAQRLTDGGR